MMAEFVGEPTELLPDECQDACGAKVPAGVLKDEDEGHQRGGFGDLSKVELRLSVHQPVAVDALSKRLEALDDLLLLKD